MSPCSLSRIQLPAACLVASGMRPRRRPPPIKVEAGLIDDDDRVHHFGLDVATAGRKLDLKYHLVNHTQKSVKIVNVVNRKPCCGVVAVGKTTLAIEEATDVVVTLSVDGRFGDVSHEAVVVTDDTPPQELVLRTVAQACPPLRVEEVGPAATSTPRSTKFRRTPYQRC
ncbi:MAG: hypothetical protein KGM43_06840 [Planctomycetota bacterium]|nr:hypothetical protein [Planctomycetota bacterium]